MITLTYTDGNSCISSDSTLITVFDDPTPDSTVINGSTIRFYYFFTQWRYPVRLAIIHANENIKHYYNADVSTNSLLIFSGVDVADGDLMLLEPISATLSMCVYDVIYVGVSETKGEDLNVSFYPNPFNETLNVVIPQGRYEISLIDILGRNVRNMSVEGDSKSREMV